MLGRFKSAIYSAIGGADVDGVTMTGDIRPSVADRGASGGKPNSPHNGAVGSGGSNRVKYAYQRPIFLQVRSEGITYWFDTF